MNRPSRQSLLAAGMVSGLLLLAAGPAPAADFDELKVKREPVFEFARKPAVTRAGDRVSVGFETRGFCDATVAIENAEGRIIRHLASGVLGPNAPAPFQKNSRQQTLVWDGKDDQEAYVDDKAGCTVRVSLGLKPQFERTLFWSPKKRISDYPPLLAAVEDGVLVCEGRGVDFVRLFDHRGNYLRTVYPFPADKLDKLQGVETRRFPQDDQVLPVKKGFVQATLLTSGSSSVVELAMKFGDGFAATGMAAKGQRIALADRQLNRLALDGTTGGLALAGAKTSISLRREGADYLLGPSSLAFSPDGNTVYLAGYFWKEPVSYLYRHRCLPVVMKVGFAGAEGAQVFAGSPKPEAIGAGPLGLKSATSVAVDSQGRVYLSDYVANRVLVFAPDGKHLKTIETARPAVVKIHPKTDELYVFTFLVPTELVADEEVQPAITRFGPFDKPEKIASEPLPFKAEKLGWYRGWGLRYSVELDGLVDPPTIWIVGQRAQVTQKTVSDFGQGVLGALAEDQWLDSSTWLLERKDGKWAVARDFAKEAAKEVVRTKPPAFSRQRLYVNPRDGKLYLTEDLGFGKSFKQMVRIDPETGKVGTVEVPFDSEDLAFDLDGLAYLRTDTLVVRYDPATWREVPFDYGEARKAVGFSSLGGGRQADVIAGLATPGQRPVFWHQGGMWVNAKGHLAVCCASRSQPADRNEGIRFRAAMEGGTAYSPMIYPGRVRWQEIHIWDRHGKKVAEDVVPGIGVSDGLGLDKDDHVYLMAALCRVFGGGGRYPNIMSGTVMKFAPRKARILGDSGHAPVPLPEADRPKRPPDAVGAPPGSAWVQGAEWLYGGAGYSGMIMTSIGFGCCCWNARYNIDYFARSFAPEIDHYSVAVLDSGGNLILRLGRYGNVDDGRPLEPKGGPPDPRPLGGDEVGLFHAAYVAAHTDRRLFIADAGNGRVLSVKLGYHQEEKVALKDVRDEAARK